MFVRVHFKLAFCIRYDFSGLRTYEFNNFVDPEWCTSCFCIGRSNTIDIIFKVIKTYISYLIETFRICSGWCFFISTRLKLGWFISSHSESFRETLPTLDWKTRSRMLCSSRMRWLELIRLSTEEWRSFKLSIPYGHLTMTGGALLKFWTNLIHDRASSQTDWHDHVPVDRTITRQLVYLFVCSEDCNEVISFAF